MKSLLTFAGLAIIFRQRLSLSCGNRALRRTGENASGIEPDGPLPHFLNRPPNSECVGLGTLSVHPNPLKELGRVPILEKGLKGS
jgi:hypothetical protein